jgi:hypothetical protein
MRATRLSAANYNTTLSSDSLESGTGSSTHTREFRTILQDIRKLTDWTVERGEFELPVPIVNSQGRQRYALQPFKAARVRCVPGMQGWTARCFD